MKLLISLLLAAGLLTGADQPKDIRFAVADEVFPHLAIGGVWSSEITFVNIEGGTAIFPLRFFRPDGTPWLVSVPGVATNTAFTVTLGLGQSFWFAVLPTGGGGVETGWAIIEQPSNATVGGHVIFADRTPGRPLFEAVVPLSLYWEKAFYMPFDNTGGNTTCVAWANSSESSDTTLLVEFFDPAGGLIHSGSAPLLRRFQVSGCLPTDLPVTAGRRGVMKVTGSSPFLSALGFRFNPGGAFTTLFPMSR